MNERIKIENILNKNKYNSLLQVKEYEELVKEIMKVIDEVYEEGYDTGYDDAENASNRPNLQGVYE